MNLRHTENLIARNELASDIGVSETTLGNWIRQGIIPAPEIRIGVRKYWRPEEANTIKKRIMRRD